MARLPRSAGAALYVREGLASVALARLTGIMVAFVVYPCAVMWVFAAKSAARAWLGLCLLAVPPGAAMLVFYFRGGAV